MFVLASKGRSSFSFLSTIKGANGSNEARNINTALPNFHFCSCQAKTNVAAYNTNSKPCAQPVYLTTLSKWSKYFMGIAINNKSR